MLASRDRTTLVAFAVAVLVGGLNFVAVRFSNRELPPFEWAALRFAAASLLFLAYARVRGIPLPRGRSLTGAVLFGLLGFSGAYAFLYWGLVSAPRAWARSRLRSSRSRRPCSRSRTALSVSGRGA